MEEGLEQYIIGKDKNILDALKKINDNGKGIDRKSTRLNSSHR